ncbi:MAG TPA: hypothetical protein VHE36_01775 [Sphingomicrobium sp.]|jgi:hypothetical protein|nr:hypothetical protein [Sphingomicrobium sp.]
MRAFDFVITLYSFVYALGVAQILGSVGDIMRAGSRVRFSWLNAGWMLNVLLAIVAWWISLWDLRAAASWTMGTVLIFFVVASLLYLLARLVSAPVPAEGTVDLNAYHHEEVRKYAGLFTLEVALTMLTIHLYGAGTQNWVGENAANWPTIAASLAATISRNRWVQAGAILVILLVWTWYFATLQSALS